MKPEFKKILIKKSVLPIKNPYSEIGLYRPEVTMGKGDFHFSEKKEYGEYRGATARCFKFQQESLNAGNFNYTDLEGIIPKNRHFLEQVTIIDRVQYIHADSSIRILKLNPVLFIQKNGDILNKGIQSFAINKLQYHINELYTLGKYTKDKETQSLILQHADNLDSIVADFMLDEQKAEADFRVELSDAIKGAQNELKTQPSRVCEVLLNLAISLTGIGAFVVAVKLFHSKITTGKPQGFFAADEPKTVKPVSDLAGTFKPEKEFNDMNYIPRFGN